MIASLEEHYVLRAIRLRQKLKAEGRSLKPEGLLIKDVSPLLKSRSDAPQCLAAQ